MSWNVSCTLNTSSGRCLHTDFSLTAVVFEPTSDAKACKLLAADPLYQSGTVLAHFAPNLQELAVFAEAARKAYPDPELASEPYRTCLKGTWFELARKSNFISRTAVNDSPPWVANHQFWSDVMVALSFTDYLWVKGGADGVCLFTRGYTLDAGDVAWHVGKLYDQWQDQPYDVKGMWFGAKAVYPIVNSIGAGDSLLGSVLAGLSRGMNAADPSHLYKLVDMGQS